jgi:AmmeMemoRadiSam system protein A
MLTYLAFSPHPPLIVPAVGGSRLRSVQATVDGMKRMAARVSQSSPDTLVFLTPHGNVFSDAISCLGDAKLKGDFSRFNASDARTTCVNDIELVNRIGLTCADQGIDFVLIDKDNASRYRLSNELDHGILVPHYYLSEAGLGKIPIVAISIGFLPLIQLYQLGTLISRSAEELGRKIAVIASGDMSHRLKSQGPYDYHPDGSRFDQEVEKLLLASDTRGLLNIPEKIRKNAGECGYPSLVIMLGCLDKYQYQSEIFSYEGPFGVGYLVAGLTPGEEKDSFLEEWQGKDRLSSDNSSIHVKWARQVLDEYLKTGKTPELPEEYKELTQTRAGAFVSLKKHGNLRGCIGTILPSYNDLSEEIAHNAVSAGIRDPRFRPVTAHEVKDLVFSVDVLSDPEPCQKEDLDPKKYGVIVTRGRRRGLLLPDLEGIDTVEEQLSVALRKAGIRPNEEYKIERFTVTRYE